MGKQSMKSIAESCTKIALAKGAKEAGAAVSRVRDVTLDWRDGKVDRIKAIAHTVSPDMNDAFWARVARTRAAQR